MNKGLKAFKGAKRIYEEEGLMGSDAKDVIDQCKATVVGASINSSPELVSEGHIVVAAPAEKRIALSWYFLQPARMLYIITGDLHSSLVGGVVSAFCFRRVTMAILENVSTTVPNEPSHPSEDVLYQLREDMQMSLS